MEKPWPHGESSRMRKRLYVLRGSQGPLWFRLSPGQERWSVFECKAVCASRVVLVIAG
jgi:hypothetical protein